MLRTAALVADSESTRVFSDIWSCSWSLLLNTSKLPCRLGSSDERVVIPSRATMRRLALLAVAIGFLAPFSSAKADPGRLNLTVGAAGDLPVAGYYAFPSKYEQSARIGARLSLGVDYVIAGPLAIELLGTVGYLFETDAQNADSGSLTASGALGLKLRLLESRSLWLSAHAGFYLFDGPQLGGDLGAGYDFSLSDRANLGLFVRWQITGLGDGENTTDMGVFGDEHWDASLMFGVSFSYALVPAEQSSEPEPEPEPETPRGPSDADGDRIIDTDDQCVNEPEDHDGTEDLDGCPEDDDRDGIEDRRDHCRDVAEDRDGFEDTDGCPEADNDQDGTDDPADECPLQPGPVYNGGCPEPDRDGDMIGDRRDNCPDEVGNPENQGCPTPQLVVITDGQLRILETVYFRLNRHQIDPRSFPLLDNVARVLLSHPEIAKIRIEGHTDTRGNARRNTQLSQRRANEVMNYLVRRASVPAERLEAVGYGPSRPLVQNATTEDEHAQNRRVEFNIVQ